MVELSVSPHIVDDVFIEICKNLDFKELEIKHFFSS